MSRPTVGDRTRRLEDFSGTLILVGAGRMGGAMLEGWIALGIDPGKIVVLEPNPSRELMKLTGRGLRVNPGERAAEASVLVIAVKPQVADEVVPALAPRVGPSSVVISIMAGRTLRGVDQRRLAGVGRADQRDEAAARAALGNLFSHRHGPSAHPRA